MLRKKLLRPRRRRRDKSRDQSYGWQATKAVRRSRSAKADLVALTSFGWFSPGVRDNAVRHKCSVIDDLLQLSLIQGPE